MKTFEKIIYDVRTDYDDQNNFQTFETEEEAIDYAKDHKEDVSYVVAVQVEVDEFDEIVNELDSEIIWSSSDEEIEDMPKDDMREDDFDSYWDEDEFGEVEEKDEFKFNEAVKQLQFDFDNDEIVEYEPPQVEEPVDDEEKITPPHLTDPRQLKFDLEEALSVEDVQAGCEEFKNLRPATIKTMIAMYCEDMDIAPRKVDLKEFCDWVKESGSLGGFALDFADDLNKLTIWDLGKEDPKFIEALKRWGVEANIIGDDWTDKVLEWEFEDNFDGEEEREYEPTKMDPEELFDLFYDKNDMKTTNIELNTLRKYFKEARPLEECTTAEFINEDAEEDDMTDEEFLEAFGAALKERKESK